MSGISWVLQPFKGRHQRNSLWLLLALGGAVTSLASWALPIFAAKGSKDAKSIFHLGYQDSQTSPESAGCLLALCQMWNGTLSRHKDKAVLVNLKKSFHLMNFLVIFQLKVLWFWRTKSSSNISPLLYVPYKHFLMGAILSLRVSNARRAFALMAQWVSAVPGSRLLRETWGNSGHLHLCFLYRWSAKKENIDSWALNSLNVCNRGADRNELFKNWHEMLPVIFRIHHFILAGICFTVGKYFHWSTFIFHWKMRDTSRNCSEQTN